MMTNRLDIALPASVLRDPTRSSRAVANTIPMPAEGVECETWLLDCTPWPHVFRHYVGMPFPFAYTSIMKRVRLAMPRKGLVRTDQLLSDLAEYVETLADGGASLGLHPDWDATEKATVMLAHTIFHPRTSFLAYTIHSTGRVVVNSGRFTENPDCARLSWHPSVLPGDRHD
jgi:hypothetical protein